MVENELKYFVVECKLQILYFFHNKTTSSNMESLQVLRQIQTVPEEAICNVKRKQNKLTEFPDKKLNKSRIVLIKAKLAY